MSILDLIDHIDDLKRGEREYRAILAGTAALLADPDIPPAYHPDLRRRLWLGELIILDARQVIADLEDTLATYSPADHV